MQYFRQRNRLNSYNRRKKNPSKVNVYISYRHQFLKLRSSRHTISTYVEKRKIQQFCSHLVSTISFRATLSIKYTLRHWIETFLSFFFTFPTHYDINLTFQSPGVKVVLIHSRFTCYMHTLWGNKKKLFSLIRKQANFIPC